MWLGSEGGEVYSHDGVDGVDQRQTVCSTSLGGTSDVTDVGNVGRQLDGNRSARHFLDPTGDLLRVIRHLPYRRAHAALVHTVWATKIQLQTVAACVFNSLDDVVPSFTLGFDHKRD